MNHRLRTWMPFLSWMPDYLRTELRGEAADKRLRGDLIAGLTVAVMLIPQGMGYAMLAGLPPIIGLYASLVPLAVYALFGTSRQLAVGPVAMVSLLVAAGIGASAEPGTATYVGYAVLLAFLVGVLQLGMGVLRLGFLVNFLSHPVISGFTSAAALIIGLSQLGHMLGLSLPRTHLVHEILIGAFSRIDEIHIITAVTGVLSVAALVLLRRYRPLFPGPLAVVAVSSLAVWGFGLHERGMAIVGDVPAGLPAFSLPAFDLAAMESLLPAALAIALVGFMESISVAKSFARRNRYEVDANQELIGLGLANLAGSLFQAYPVTGGFSRTAVNAQAGAKSGLASLITAALIGLTLLFFTPLFYYLPKVVLAAIIMTAVFKLIDLAEVAHLWRVKRGDLVFLVVTFAATLALGIEEGILVGVGASLVAFILRTTRPHIAVLGRLPESTVYRNVLRYPEAETVPGVLVVRIDAQLYFGNASYFKEALARFESERDEPLTAVVLDAGGINQIDSSAVAMLSDLYQAYRRRGVALYLAGVKGPVRDVLARAQEGADGHGGIDPDCLVRELHEAVQHASAHASARARRARTDAGEPDRGRSTSGSTRTSETPRATEPGLHQHATRPRPASP